MNGDEEDGDEDGDGGFVETQICAHVYYAPHSSPPAVRSSRMEPLHASMSNTYLHLADNFGLVSGCRNCGFVDVRISNRRRIIHLLVKPCMRAGCGLPFLPWAMRTKHSRRFWFFVRPGRLRTLILGITVAFQCERYGLFAHFWASI